jgi:hypothetical protein
MDFDARLLGIYLNDHLAGSSGGVALARRMLRENRDNALGRELERLVPEIEADRGTLLEMMRRTGVPARRYKAAAARIGEIGGRLKLNGRLLSYSPLSRLSELEWLIIGIEGKASMWRSLREAEVSALRDVDFASLIARADEQQGVLEDRRHEVAVAAFAMSGDTMRAQG